MLSSHGRFGGVHVLPTALVGLMIAGIAMATAYALFVLTETGDKVFCGDPLVQGYQKCVDQMALFAIASLIPAMLALILMVAAFATPALRAKSTLRAQTLGYSLVAWLIAGGTLVMGWLPAI